MSICLILLSLKWVPLQSVIGTSECLHEITPTQLRKYIYTADCSIEIPKLASNDVSWVQVAVKIQQHVVLLWAELACFSDRSESQVFNMSQDPVHSHLPLLMLLACLPLPNGALPPHALGNSPRTRTYSKYTSLSYGKI